MQAPVFNTGIPITDAFYLVQVPRSDIYTSYLSVWKFYQGRWSNIHNEPLHDKNVEVLWALIPDLAEWSDVISDAPLGPDILIIDEYGRPEVSSVVETEETPPKRKWYGGYTNPGLWHIISAPLVENFENDEEDGLNVKNEKASYRNLSDWRYPVQEMKRYDYNHDADLDCDKDVDCMTPQQINDQLAAIEQLNLRIGNHRQDVIRGILPPPNYEWESYADKKDWCNMILNLPYRLPNGFHGIPRSLRDWCLDAARTLP